MRRTDAGSGRRLLLAGAIALTATACGTAEVRMTAATTVVPEPAVETDSVVPNDSLRAWATFADALVVGTVTAEHESVEPDDLAIGEGPISRRVDVDVISVPWTRSGATGTPPAQITFTTWGWTFDGGQRSAMIGGADRLEVGSTYLMPVAEFDADGWSPIHPSATMAVRSGVIGPMEVEPEFPWMLELVGQRPDDIARALSATPSDPKVADAPTGADPIERASVAHQAEQREVASTSTTGP